jgi:hypothetical protein
MVWHTAYLAHNAYMCLTPWPAAALNNQQQTDAAFLMHGVRRTAVARQSLSAHARRRVHDAQCLYGQHEQYDERQGTTQQQVGHQMKSCTHPSIRLLRVSTHSVQIIVDKSTFAYLNRSLESFCRLINMKRFRGGMMYE